MVLKQSLDSYLFFNSTAVLYIFTFSAKKTKTVKEKLNNITVPGKQITFSEQPKHLTKLSPRFGFIQKSFFNLQKKKNPVWIIILWHLSSDCLWFFPSHCVYKDRNYTHICGINIQNITHKTKAYTCLAKAAVLLAFWLSSDHLLCVWSCGTDRGERSWGGSEGWRVISWRSYIKVSSLQSQ